MAFAHDDQRFVPILQREHGDGASDVRHRHRPLWVKPANPDILPGLQTCKVIRNTHVSSEFESSLLLRQSGKGGVTAAKIKGSVTRSHDNYLENRRRSRPEAACQVLPVSSIDGLKGRKIRPHRGLLVFEPITRCGSSLHQAIRTNSKSLGCRRP